MLLLLLFVAYHHKKVVVVIFCVDGMMLWGDRSRAPNYEFPYVSIPSDEWEVSPHQGSENTVTVRP